MCEAAERIGGGMRSFELTLPGFVHDECSAVHPLAQASPVFQSFDLDVEWIHPDAPAAHPFDDGTAILLERSVDETSAGLGREGRLPPLLCAARRGLGLGSRRCF